MNNEQRTTNNATVLNGIDVLEKTNFKDLEGLRIGLVTNQTGRNLNGKPTIDVLKEAKNVNLVALFSPEHGIRGELDQEKITDSKDEKTGLADLFALWRNAPTKTRTTCKIWTRLSYDIQDIGDEILYIYFNT